MRDALSKFCGWLMCLIILVVTLLAGCEHIRKRSLESTPLAGSDFPSAVWQAEDILFVDPDLGLKLNIPREWSIHLGARSHPADSLAVTLSSPCPHLAPDVVPPCTVIRLSLGPSSIRDLKGMRNSIREEGILSDGVTVLEEQELRLHGLPALWLKIENKSISEHAVVHVMVLVDEQVVNLKAYGELSPVWDIANSIQALEQLP
jgi:hypothetical protein